MSEVEEEAARVRPAISMLKFPFKLTKDQIEAVEGRIINDYKGSIIYSAGTGKTEIAYECARRACEAIVHREDNRASDNDAPFNILLFVPRTY